MILTVSAEQNLNKSKKETAATKSQMVLHSYCLSAFQFLSILKLVEGQCCLTSRDGQEFSLTSTAAAAVGLTSLLCRSLELAVFYHYTYGLLYQQP
jgi:hypothetical protein